MGSGSGSGHCGANTAMKSGLATWVDNVESKEIFFSCNLPSLPGSLRTQVPLSFFSFLPNSRSPEQFDLGVDVQGRMVIKMLKRMFRTHLFSLDIEQSKDGEEDDDDDDHYDDHRLWVGRGGVHLG